MKHVAVLGSTGSIGTQSLEVLASLPDYKCTALCCGGASWERLNRQIKTLYDSADFEAPLYVGISDERYKKLIYCPCGVQLIAQKDAADLIASMPGIDIVINGISGFNGLSPLLFALKSGKTVALANKESIVCGHRLIDEALMQHKGQIIPVDSEQSAIFQCLSAGRFDDVSRLILTASGGAFRDIPTDKLCQMTFADALCHPNWNMGERITVDSASMFNKGLEIMEAAFLFGINDVDVLIHRESIVHSMVEFKDGSVIAQLAVPDMRLAIQYALTYPNRVAGTTKRLDLNSVGSLTFESIDADRYPAIPLAYSALEDGNSLPIAYNASDEMAVSAFKQGKIRFTDIAAIVEGVMNRIAAKNFGIVSCSDDIIAIDAYSRELALDMLKM